MIIMIAKIINRIIKMHRFGNGQGAEFAESYLLEYWRPRLGRWVRYRNIQNSEVIITIIFMMEMLMMSIEERQSTWSQLQKKNQR